MMNKNFGEKIEELEIDVNCSKESAKALREQVEDLEDGYDQLKKKNRNLTRDLEMAKEESIRWKLKYEKAIADDDNDDQKIKDLNKANDELQDEIDRLKNECEKLKRENEDYKEKVTRYEKTLDQSGNFEA